MTKHVSPPHTFEHGDVLDREVNLRLPDDLASGEYTLDLAVEQMAGTKGARTALHVVTYPVPQEQALGSLTRGGLEAVP